ncbi:MAG: hypothetical protein P4L70_12525 [Parasulfuritortus sp.]|jgi:ribosomal protein S20|nr:hypothetical protein [Parasulfuritortus sp.]
MSISKIGLDPSVSQGTKSSTLYKAQQDFNALFQAMTNNDISGAQQAYAAIQQLQPSASNTQASATQSDPLTTVKSDWTSLGQALQSGSLTSAQQAFTQLGQDALAAQQARHQQVIASTSALRNDVQSINEALKSGDTTSAQKLLAQLEQNLQNSRASFGHHHPHTADQSAVSTSTTSATTSTGTTGSTTA